MGEDWFEQALNELDDEPATGETADDGAGDDETAGESMQPIAGSQPAADPSPQEADVFGFGTTEPAGGADDAAEPAASAGDEFGFGAVDESAAGSADAGPAAGGASGGPADGADEFGFGGAATGSDEFDDATLDSELDRIKIGIDGLDRMIRGGIPDRSLLSVIGGAGTGKTTFGLQFIETALSRGDRAVFITLEQTEESVLATAEEMGWPFRQYHEEGLLSVVVLDPVDMANSLASIRNDISRLIRDFGATRLVLDSVSLLEMMYDHPARRRSEVYNFTRSLKEAGVTTMLISEANQDAAYASRHGMVEYLTDAVFFLQYVRSANSQETRTAVEIQKIRNASHSRERKPYELTDSGISVYQQANIF